MKRSSLIPLLSIAVVMVLNNCNDDDGQPAAGSPKKLDNYIDSYSLSGAGLDAQTKVTYEYNASGSVSKYTVYTIAPKSGAVQEQRHFVFQYSGTRLEKITAYEAGAGTFSLEDTYEYLPDGRVSKIKEVNTPAAVTSEANFTYDIAKGSTKVFYTYSNGGSFEYEFEFSNNNIVRDKTTKGTELCSDGQYTYDDHINPLGALGYVDYLLTTVSANNKLTEVVNHVNCSFPSFIPESYSYTYDADGYPKTVTTLYKTSGDDQPQSVREYFYQ